MRFLWLCTLAAVALCPLLTPARARADEVDAAMLRFPDVSDKYIVFVYDNDVWLAPKEGGSAIPLSSPPGLEQLPRFSPDGNYVAFSANYDGNVDVYSMPISGGIPTRLTYEPWPQTVVDWSPDGRVMFYSSGQQARGSDLELADMHGGLPTPLPVQQGAFGSFSADGKWLAFTPWTQEFRTWNRYQGGTATDIWLFNMDTHESRKLTDFPGNDDMPMIHGQWVYYLSECGDECRRNIWRVGLDGGQREQITHFTDYDVKWPSIGPSDIVFENGGKLWLLSLDSHALSEVHIQLPGDRPHVRPQMVDVSGMVDHVSVSPGAKRVTCSARGDIWTLPAENGYPQNLTRSNGSEERDPSWSPDGKWIAYFSDATGEYELYIRPADGTGEAKQLTKDGHGYRFDPIWSPDSKKIAFTDKDGWHLIHLVDSGETIKVERNMLDPHGLQQAWSGDSNWLAYTVGDPLSKNMVIKVYDLAKRESHPLTSGFFNSSSPSFDRSGDYLYFATDRNLSALKGGLDDGETFFWVNSTQLVAMPLRKDVGSPIGPRNDTDADAQKDEDKKDGDKGGAGLRAGQDSDKQEAGTESRPTKKGKDRDDKPKPVTIDWEGAEARSVILPVDAGQFWNVLGADKQVYYLRNPHGDEGEDQLCTWSIDDRKETKLLHGVGGFDLTPEGKHLLVNARGTWFITGSGQGANLDKAIATGGMNVELDPRQEWREIITQAWRLYRDYFYDPNMHHVDWVARRDRALHLVDYAASREDVDYILGWMISELNSSHTYVWGDPQAEPARAQNVGLLGCDFERATDAQGHSGYRITHLLCGAVWELDQRSPLCQPGVDVHEGDFLLAVNGVALDQQVSPYAALQGMADRATRITVSTKAVLDKDARSYLVQPVGSENELRLRDWIEANRKKVYEATGGKAGYIYVRSTGREGLTDLQRQFMGQHDMDALVIDERWNSGGDIPHRFVELLNRPVRSYFQRRDFLPAHVPGMAHFGPQVMLINHAAGSGGDAFPFYFRQAGLGKLVGTRTWGGLIAIDGNPGLIDGGYLTVPTLGNYKPDGTWGIEGHGVDPDIVVYNDPTSLAAGQDLQLDAAITEIKAELAAHPPVTPPPPPFPDRSKEGVPKEMW